MSDVVTLAEALPKEQKRVRDLIPLYESIGLPGKFAVLMMKRALEQAEVAAASGDVIAMLQAHEELKGFKE